MRRHEPELARSSVVPAAGDDDVAEPAQRGAAGVPVDEREQRMAGASGAVGLQCAFVAAGSALHLRQRGAVRPCCARRREEGPVRLLCGVRELPLEAVEQDCGAPLDERERVAPEPQRQTEAEMRGEQRIRTLTREVGRRARNPDADRVELTVERDAAQLDAAKERLGVRDCRWAGEHCSNGALERERPQHVGTCRLGQQLEQESKR